MIWPDCGGPRGGKGPLNSVKCDADQLASEKNAIQQKSPPWTHDIPVVSGSVRLFRSHLTDHLSN